ncbi:MAG: AI-2E family transporter [Candidatus Eremiobacteraeota bacterium]|nr:AI-2E family transporter [Candidatus Eremiobacteraeota bacterium]
MPGHNAGRVAVALESRKIQNLCLLVIAGTCLGAVLYFLQGVLVPFTLALFLNMVISPTVDIQVARLRFPRWLAVTTTLALSCLMLISFAALIATSLNQLLANVEDYESRFQDLFWAAFHRIPESIGKRINIGSLLDLLNGTISSGLKALTDGIIYLLSQFTLVFLFLLFLLLGEAKGAPGGLLAEVELRSKRYLLTKIGISALTAILVGAVLSLARVELALVFALVTFVLNFVPNVGSMVATFLPVPMLIFSPVLSLWGALLVLSVLFVIQFLLGNIVEPKVLGRTLSLHPVIVLLALLIWGTLWGPVGAVLAVPITATLQIILEHVDEGRAIAMAMAGKLPGKTEVYRLEGEGELRE